MNTKKCPFCAYDEIGFRTVTIGGHYKYRVVCSRCNALGPNESSTDLAVVSWNMRREVDPSVQTDAEAYEDPRNATPEELLEAMIWFYRQDGTISAAEAEDTIALLRLGFTLARPGGWERVAPLWLRESRKIAALDIEGE